MIDQKIKSNFPDESRKTISRRAMLLSTTALVATYGFARSSLADDESFGGDLGEDREPRYMQDEDSYFEKRTRSEFGDLTGLDFRFPTCGIQQLSPIETMATATPLKAPSYVDGKRSAYFSDDANRSFLSGSGDQLDLASDKLSAASGVRYHLFNAPTELPRGQSVIENLRALLKGIDQTSLGGKFEAIWTARLLIGNGGAWNYKRSYGSQWEDAGNFNYGFIAAGLGIREQDALRFAGFYGTWFGQPNPDGGHYWDLNSTGPYGDFPEDQQQIRNGYEYYYHRELIDALYATPQPHPAIEMAPSPSTPATLIRP